MEKVKIEFTNIFSEKTQEKMEKLFTENIRGDVRIWFAKFFPNSQGYYQTYIAHNFLTESLCFRTKTIKEIPIKEIVEHVEFWEKEAKRIKQEYKFNA